MQYRNINMYRMLIPKTVVNYYNEKVKDHKITVLKHAHRVHKLLQDVFTDLFVGICENERQGPATTVQIANN